MKYFYILIGLSVSFLFVGCASTMKDADKGLEKIHRKVDSVYESIREFTDPLGLPITLEPIDPNRNYSSYKDEYQFEHVANSEQRYCEIKGIPAGSTVEVFYSDGGYQFAYTVWEKDGKATIVVPKEGVMNLHVTIAETGVTHFFFDLPCACDYKWQWGTKQLDQRCPKEVSE